MQRILFSRNSTLSSSNKISNFNSLFRNANPNSHIHHLNFKANQQSNQQPHQFSTSTSSSYYIQNSSIEHLKQTNKQLLSLNSNKSVHQKNQNHQIELIPTFKSISNLNSIPIEFSKTNYFRYFSTAKKFEKAQSTNTTTTPSTTTNTNTNDSETIEKKPPSKFTIILFWLGVGGLIVFTGYVLRSMFGQKDRSVAMKMVKHIYKHTNIQTYHIHTNIHTNTLVFGKIT